MVGPVEVFHLLKAQETLKLRKNLRNLLRIFFKTNLAVLKLLCRLNIALIDLASLLYRLLYLAWACRRSVLTSHFSTLSSSSFITMTLQYRAFLTYRQTKSTSLPLKSFQFQRLLAVKPFSNDTDVLKSNFSSSKLNCIGN